MYVAHRTVVLYWFVSTVVNFFLNWLHLAPRVIPLSCISVLLAALHGLSAERGGCGSRSYNSLCRYYPLTEGTGASDPLNFSLKENFLRKKRRREENLGKIGWTEQSK